MRRLLAVLLALLPAGAGAEAVYVPLKLEPVSILAQVVSRGIGGSSTGAPVSGTTGTFSSLTAGRVVFAGTGGLLSDDADFTFNTTGNVLFVGGTIELGHATANTLSASGGVLSVEGVTVPLNATTATHTAQQIELGAATDTTIARATAGSVTIEGKGVPIVLCKGATTATTGTVEEVVATCPIPANALSADYDKLEIHYNFQTAANANNKQIRMRLGASGSGLTGVLLYNSTAVASNNEVWGNGFGAVYVTRLTSATVRAMGSLTRSALGAATSLTAHGAGDNTEVADFTVAQDFVITATTPTASADVTAGNFMVILYR